MKLDKQDVPMILTFSETSNLVIVGLTLHSRDKAKSE